MNITTARTDDHDAQMRCIQLEHATARMLDKWGHATDQCMGAAEMYRLVPVDARTDALNTALARMARRRDRTRAAYYRLATARDSARAANRVAA